MTLLKTEIVSYSFLYLKHISLSLAWSRCSVNGWIDGWIVNSGSAKFLPWLYPDCKFGGVGEGGGPLIFIQGYFAPTWAGD